MDVKQIFLLIIFQGLPLGFVCQRNRYRMTALLGSCVEFPCTYRSYHDASVVWYVGDSSKREILNTKNSSLVKSDYKDRTSLVPGDDSCALRIDPVRRGDEKTYNVELERRKYPYTTVILHVTGFPEDPELSVFGYFIDGEATTIRCSVDHTCRSSPPSLQWNKPGQVIKWSLEISEGSWREVSELTYIPSYEDDGSSLQCKATYPNGQKTERSRTLIIYTAPKYVTVTVITQNGQIMEGTDVTLVCTSISRPEATDYEWYKGRNKTKLPYTGWKMTVYNVTKDMEPYSCTAVNRVGRGESALTEIPVLYGDGCACSFMDSNGSLVIIFLAAVGAVCPLLVVVLVYVLWRNRRRKVTRIEADESSDTTNSDSVKNDTANDYVHMNPIQIKGGATN